MRPSSAPKRSASSDTLLALGSVATSAKEEKVIEKICYTRVLCW